MLWHFIQVHFICNNILLLNFVKLWKTLRLLLLFLLCLIRNLIMEEKSFVPCEDLRYGRFSFKGFNPEVEVSSRGFIQFVFLFLRGHNKFCVSQRWFFFFSWILSPQFCFCFVFSHYPETDGSDESKRGEGGGACGGDRPDANGRHGRRHGSEVATPHATRLFFCLFWLYKFSNAS